MKNLLLKLLHFFLVELVEPFRIEKTKFSYGGQRQSVDDVSKRIMALNSETEKLPYGGRQRADWECPNGYTKSEDGTYCVYTGGSSNYDKDFYEGNMQEAKGFVVKGKFIPMDKAREINSYDKDFLRGLKPTTVVIPRPSNTAVTFKPRGEGPADPVYIPEPAMDWIKPVIKDKPVTVIPTESAIAGADEFDITITKTIGGVGIPNNLPVVLFSPMFRASDYSTLVGNLPATVTLVVSNIGTDNVAFTYTDGADSVVLTISADQTPYTSILSALTTDRFDVVRIRESISDVTQLGQLNLPLQVSTGSMFGGQSFNTISALAAKGPWQDQDTIIDFNFQSKFDKARAIRLFILGAAPTGFSVTLAIWAEHVRKY